MQVARDARPPGGLFLARVYRVGENLDACHGGEGKRPGRANPGRQTWLLAPLGRGGGRRQEPPQGLAVDGGEAGQLDGIEPPLAALHLRHESLPRADLPADLGLGEAGIPARLPQAL